MKNKKAFIIALIFSFSILIFMIFNTAYSLRMSYIIPWHLYAVPCVTFAASMLFTVLKKIPGIIKCIVSVFLSVLTLAFCLLFNCMGYTEFRAYEGIEGINKFNEEYEQMDFRKQCQCSPIDAEDYGDFIDIDFYYYDSISIFSDRGRIVIVQYSPEEFGKQKEAIEKDSYDEAFREDGFEFRIKKNQSYPKTVSFRGFNSETNEIAEIHFQNMDLDEISDYNDFLLYYCGWAYIK